jgi:hypothetical protein
MATLTLRPSLNIHTPHVLAYARAHRITDLEALKVVRAAKAERVASLMERLTGYLFTGFAD